MNTLEQKIIEYQKRGWILVSQTDNAAQLRKPKKSFSCLPNILCTILFFIGLSIFSKNDEDLGGILMVIGAVYPVIYFSIYIFNLILKREKYKTIIADDKEK